MRCPNEKCRREIPIDATEHKLCGWRASAAPPLPRDVAPPAPAEPEVNPEQRAATQERMRKMLADVFSRPKPDPLARWKRILDDPKACLFAKEAAAGAIAQLERRAATEARIRAEAERQEQARQIVQRQREDDARDGRAERLYRQQSHRERPADPPPPSDDAPDPASLPLGLAEDPLEKKIRLARQAGEDPLATSVGDRPANPRAAARRNVSRGTTGASQTPNRSGHSRARRR